MVTGNYELAEHRVICNNVSWHIFEQLLTELGEDR